MYFSRKIYNSDYFFLSQEILYCYGETMSTVGVISKVFSYLDRTPKCEKAGELAPEKLEGRIVFQNVSFTYPAAPSDKPALKVTVWQADSTSLTWCPDSKIVFWIVTLIQSRTSHNCIIALLTCSVQSVSMELQPGKMTALVGPSGSGKSSCVSLLKRLYEPQEGQILLDGEPLHHYKHKYLHQKVQ